MARVVARLYSPALLLALPRSCSFLQLIIPSQPLISQAGKLNSVLWIRPEAERRAAGRGTIPIMCTMLRGRSPQRRHY